MYKVIDDGKEYYYNNIQLVTSVADLTCNAQYIFVQEDRAIVIWKVAHTNCEKMFPEMAAQDLIDYYKRHHDRNFDNMIKKLVSL